MLVHLLTYLHSWLGRIKPAISPKRLKIERKLVLMAYIKSYTGFRLPPKCMTLNDLCTRFKVIDSLNAAKMAKYSLVMSPTPCVTGSMLLPSVDGGGGFGINNADGDNAGRPLRAAAVNGGGFGKF